MAVHYGNLPRVRMTQYAGRPAPEFEIDGTGIAEDYSFAYPYGMDDERVRVQVEFMAILDLGADWQAERLKAKQAAALAEAVDHWTVYRERYYAGQPLILAVLDLHQPEGGYKQAVCAHCEQHDGMESTENVPWPCATYKALTTDREQVAEADGCAVECSSVELGEAIDFEVPEGGIRSRYDVTFQPDEIKAVRAAAEAAGKTTSAYLHDLAVDATSPVTVNVTVQGAITTEQDIARAIQKSLLRHGMGGSAAYHL